MNSTACMHRRMAKFHPGIVKGMTACWSHIGLIIVEEKQHCSDPTPLHGNKEVAIMLCLHNLYNNVLVRRRTASHLFKLISILTKGSLTPHGPARVMLLELQR